MTPFTTRRYLTVPAGTPGAVRVFDGDQVTYAVEVGLRVRKERKPFKSGGKVNTVKGVVDHPVLHVPAYTFEEDDSIVECRRCFPA